MVLLDEPSSGIAQREVEALAPVLLRLRDEMGASLLVIEHDMPLISSITDRLIALDQGAVLASGTPADVLDPSRRDRELPGEQRAGVASAPDHQGVATCNQPARQVPTGNRQLKRWGPIVGVVVVVADRSSAWSSPPAAPTTIRPTSTSADRSRHHRRRHHVDAPTDSTPPTRHRSDDASPPAVTVPAVVRSQAAEQGIADTIDWGDALRHRRPAGSPCPTSSPSRATRRSAVTTAAPLHPA